MPAVQHVFASAVQIRTNLPAFDRVYGDVRSRERADDAAGEQTEPLASAPREALAVQRAIELRDVTFRYPGASGPALEGFNLTLNAKATTGIVGSTGSGKTTVLDLLLGLLRPEAGALLVDGVRVEPEDLEAFQRSLGYVPQHIYLSDTSVARNVAFGVPEHQLDRARVEEACRIAQIHDFIMRALPNGYDTPVGERGVRLSGGERQRIGIARALYRSPDVLILDEATSALDTATEEAVMQALEQFAGQKTIIMVAHRETTLRQCDVIYRISHGQLELVGSHAALLGQQSRPSPFPADEARRKATR
jgi:ABC-type multidrug transport system fused ATPase/permease subunit